MPENAIRRVATNEASTIRVMDTKISIVWLKNIDSIIYTVASGKEEYNVTIARLRSFSS